MKHKFSFENKTFPAFMKQNFRFESKTFAYEKNLL